MKIQCDVCNKNEASVYCAADEAALCTDCDHRVHHANKLAGKHPRFSLHTPSSPKDAPICDICQEKKAFLFCQQDRAILCKDCDDGIHNVNQHTKNHNRFVLTGVKLSPTATLYSNNNSPVVDPTPIMKDVGIEKKKCQQDVNGSDHGSKKRQQEVNGSGHGSDTSSISEYLIDMLPGWHVEDLLDPIPNFSKVGDNDLAQIWGDDILDGNLNSSFSPELMGMWVPQAPTPLVPPSRYSHMAQQVEPSLNMGFGDQIMNGSSLAFDPNSYNSVNKIASGIKAKKSSRKWPPDNDNFFMVPQISPPSTMSKRSRTLWQ
ncbi:B-box-type zinc finger [Artemisia annua]|uniref:B-box-type zinc finger n=1 Tax=Artemisia annua TaxID=35608 RepID=A0A2U1PQA7_ARTAN|nr:B-box-type zinc finger [Artemisia annua]